MGANQYHFIDKWRVKGSVEEITAILSDGAGLSRWWPSVYLDSTEVEKGGKGGIGKAIDVRTQGRLPYQLRWRATTIENNSPNGFTISAAGDFVGSGEWTFVQDGEWADVTFDWQVSANAPVLRYGSFIVKPFLADNHRWAMRMGEKSIMLELQRRHAKSAAELAAIPAPPEPYVDVVLSSAISGGILAVFGLLIFGGLRLVALLRR